MDVLLVNPPTLHQGKSVEALGSVAAIPSPPYYASLLALDDAKPGRRSTFTGEHLGLQSLQSALERAGHRTFVLNACVEMHTSLQQTLSRMRTYGADVIGFTGPLEVFGENVW